MQTAQTPKCVTSADNGSPTCPNNIVQPATNHPPTHTHTRTTPFSQRGFGANSPRNQDQQQPLCYITPNSQHGLLLLCVATTPQPNPTIFSQICPSQTYPQSAQPTSSSTAASSAYPFRNDGKRTSCVKMRFLLRLLLLLLVLL